MSERSISVMSCIEVMAYCWLLALLLALGIFVVFLGNIAAGWIADIAIFAMLWIIVILMTNIIIVRGLIIVGSDSVVWVMEHFSIGRPERFWPGSLAEGR